VGGVSFYSILFVLTLFGVVFTIRGFKHHKGFATNPCRKDFTKTIDEKSNADF
jgi:hypothetical protein